MISDPERRFILSLAMQLGYANPDAMLAQMDSKHVTEWLAYGEYLEWERENMKGR